MANEKPSLEGREGMELRAGAACAFLEGSNVVFGRFVMAKGNQRVVQVPGGGQRNVALGAGFKATDEEYVAHEAEVLKRKADAAQKAAAEKAASAEKPPVVPPTPPAAAVVPPAPPTKPQKVVPAPPPAAE